VIYTTIVELFTTTIFSSFTILDLFPVWTSAINLKGNYGAHSLKKTWGYIQRTVYGVGFEVICKRFNHSSPAITMRYLGIEDKEVQGILMNEVG
jgi:hypothetical protein